MADAEEKYCTNCKRQIAVANFVMHEVHCKRNIVLCGQCNEPVPRSELDSHMEEEHATEPCSLCQSDIEKSKADDHRKVCVKRPAHCSFCELEVPFCDLNGHEDYCGSRTEQCPLCSQFIMLKDRSRHENSSCTYPAPPKPAAHVMNNSRPQYRGGRHNTMQEDTDVLPQGFCNAFAMDEISRMLNFDLPYPVDAGIDIIPARNVNVDRSDRQQPNTRTSSSSNVSTVRGGRQRNVTNKNKRTNETVAQQNRDSGGAQERGARSQVEADIDHLLAMHLAHDLSENSSSSSQENNTYRTAGVNEKRTSPLPSKFSSSPLLGDDICLPCEFCGELLPSDSLMQHQSFCNTEGVGEMHNLPNMEQIHQNNIYLPDAGEDISPDVTIDRQLLMQNMLMNNMAASNSNRVRVPPSRPPILDNLSHDNNWLSSPVSDDDIMLPCEFCEELIQQDILLQHQATCDVYNRLYSASPDPDQHSAQAAALDAQTRPQAAGSQTMRYTQMNRNALPGRNFSKEHHVLPGNNLSKEPSRKSKKHLKNSSEGTDAALKRMQRNALPGRNLSREHNVLPGKNFSKEQSRKSPLDAQSETPARLSNSNHANTRLNYKSSSQSDYRVDQRYNGMDSVATAGLPVQTEGQRSKRNRNDRESRRIRESEHLENRNGGYVSSPSNESDVLLGAASNYHEVDNVPSEPRSSSRRQRNSARVRHTLNSLIQDPTCTTEDLLEHLDKEEKTRFNSVTVMKDRRPIQTGSRRNSRGQQDTVVDNDSSAPYQASFVSSQNRASKSRHVNKATASPDLGVSGAPLSYRRTNAHYQERSSNTKSKKPLPRYRRPTEE